MDKKGILEALITHYTGGNKSQFAKLLGVKPQTINTWDARSTFDLELIYSKCEGISGDWLLTGEGSMLKPSTSPKDATGAAPSQSGESMGKDTKQSAASPRKAPKDAPTATTALMDYIREKDAVIAQKDAIIEQKNQEIMQLRCDGARLEAECRHLSAEVARLSSGLSPKPSPEVSPSSSEVFHPSSEESHPSSEVAHPSSEVSPDTPARS